MSVLAAAFTRGKRVGPSSRSGRQATVYWTGALSAGREEECHPHELSMKAFDVMLQLGQEVLQNPWPQLGTEVLRNLLAP